LVDSQQHAGRKT